MEDSGESVGGAGDLNGDGLADLIVGAPDSEAPAGEDEELDGQYASSDQNGEWNDYDEFESQYASSDQHGEWDDHPDSDA